ncbi:hypothetical protein FA95DRAFT_1453117, partial [Auriscalpium vulgare]
MSSDSVAVEGPSIIYRGPSQTGPSGPCAILGPFRLVNHDCNPNCHISPIPQTAACTVTTVRNVEPGEDITVKYSKSGYYREGCACKTC